MHMIVQPSVIYKKIHKKTIPHGEWRWPGDVLLSQGEAPYYHRR